MTVAAPETFRWSREMYDRMVEAGTLGPETRVQPRPRGELPLVEVTAGTASRAHSRGRPDGGRLITVFLIKLKYRGRPSRRP